MIVHFNRFEYSVQLPEEYDPVTLLQLISKEVKLPEESIVLCSFENVMYEDNVIAELKPDSHVIVYEKGKVIQNGLNKEGLCVNESCSMYRKEVVENCGFTSCERIFVGCTGKCPICCGTFEVSKIYLKNCHFSYNIISEGREPMSSKEIDAIGIIPEDYDVDFDPTVEYDFSVQKVDHYICKVCHLSINDEDHNCERVRKYSKCRHCSDI